MRWPVRFRWVPAFLALAAGGLLWAGGSGWARAGPPLLQAVALGRDGQPVWMATGNALVALAPGGARAPGGLSTGVRQILVDPGNPDQIYALPASGRGILRSRDGGRHWTLARGHGLPAAPIRAMAYDPSGPTRLVALVAGHGYYQSDLAGEMWMRLGPEDVPGATAMAINPLDPRVVLVGTPSGLYRSTNQGMRFEPVPAGDPWQLRGAVYSLAVAGDRSALVAATAAGLFRSRDGGRSWAPLGDPGLGAVVAVAFAPGRSQMVVAGSRAGALAMSRDGGQTWSRLR